MRGDDPRESTSATAAQVAAAAQRIVRMLDGRIAPEPAASEPVLGTSVPVESPVI